MTTAVERARKWYGRLPGPLGNAYRRLRPKDRTIGDMSYWWHGDLERKPIEQILAVPSDVAISLLKPADRTYGTSVTLQELTCLVMAVQAAGARRVLEIGTFDGNTALNLAANLPDDGRVVTVDLPVEFSAEDDLAIDCDTRFRNVTRRNRVGAQFRGHRLEARIQQIYADSAQLDFDALGTFDLAFIDGCHSYEYVRADSANVLKVVRSGGIIAWHDYGSHASVSAAVDELRDHSRLDGLAVVEGTRLAIARVR